MFVPPSLIALERYDLDLDPALLDAARRELRPAGYVLGVHADRRRHPACVALAEVLTEPLEPGFELSFLRLDFSGAAYERMHLDTHPDLTEGVELLRVLMNLSEHPRRFRHEHGVVAMPGRSGGRVHALRFLASAIRHVGLNDQPEHFLASFERLVPYQKEARSSTPSASSSSTDLV